MKTSEERQQQRNHAFSITCCSVWNVRNVEFSTLTSEPVLLSSILSASQLPRLFLSVCFPRAEKLTLSKFCTTDVDEQALATRARTF